MDEDEEDDNVKNEPVISLEEFMSRINAKNMKIL
jgi:hypothetical protein